MHKKQTSTKQKKNPRISLKEKWAETVGVGIFETFETLLMILYGAMRQSLIKEERRTETDTLNTVVQRLLPESGDLTMAQVGSRLEGTTPSEESRLPTPSERHTRILLELVS